MVNKVVPTVQRRPAAPAAADAETGPSTPGTGRGTPAANSTVAPNEGAAPPPRAGRGAPGLDERPSLPAPAAISSSALARPIGRLTPEQLQLRAHTFQIRMHERNLVAAAAAPHAEPRFVRGDNGLAMRAVLDDFQGNLPQYYQTAEPVPDRDPEEPPRWTMKTVNRMRPNERHDVKPADGVYIFIIKDGEPNKLHMVKRGAGADNAGHTSFREARVLMAGEIKFNDGRLVEWSTRSGHFMPPDDLISGTILPRDRCKGFLALTPGKTTVTGVAPPPEPAAEVPAAVDAEPSVPTQADLARALIKQVAAEKHETLSAAYRDARAGRQTIAVQSKILSDPDVTAFLKAQAISKREFRDHIDDVWDELGIP